MNYSARIPRCMSTQHPDNVGLPFFTEVSELGGEDEIREAYYAFSHLGVDEQMWDCEGKEVDSFVIKKLLTRYESFFKNKRIGKDVRITLRVPNPTVEKPEAKVLLETLESIPRSFDAAKMFFGDNIPPIFEVILPMTASAKCLDRVYSYYSDFVVGKKNRLFKEGDITIAEWIGEFMPEKINVIPLFEDMQHMLRAPRILKSYMHGKDLSTQRIFLARSDPAMNYGMVSAVLLNKIALQRIQQLSRETGVETYPIVGVGSAPFRGNLRPDTVERVCDEYPSAHTLTIQSAFKYDYPADAVRMAIEKLIHRETGAAQEVDEERCIEIIRKFSEEYRRQILPLAPMINKLARFVPGRRKRKLHTGLFGYSRNIGDVNLPRVITFTCALYSFGLPPEILGLNALSREDLKVIRKVYIHFEEDLRDALKYFNPALKILPEKLNPVLQDLLQGVTPDQEHQRCSELVLEALNSSQTEKLEETIIRAAMLRRFLG